MSSPKYYKLSKQHCIAHQIVQEMMLASYTFFIAGFEPGLRINKKLGRKIVNIFLSIRFNISSEYPQRMFWLRNKKIKF